MIADGSVARWVRRLRADGIYNGFSNNAPIKEPDRVRDQSSAFAVPDLLFDEMLAVLVRILSPDYVAVAGYVADGEHIGL